jgi:hypothetical protein
MEGRPPPSKKFKQLDLKGYFQQPKQQTSDNVIDDPPNSPFISAYPSAAASSVNPPPISPIAISLVEMETMAPQKTSDSNPTKSPSVWTPAQFKKWTEKHPWIEIGPVTGKVGCSTCSRARLLVTTSQGVHLSDSWVNYKIEAATARKLKEKIYKHVQSAAHKEAENVQRAQNEGRLECIIVDQTSRLFSETIRIFRTAYAVAKNDLPFTVHGKLVELQRLNGVEVGRIHRSDHSCAAIIKSISTLMRKSLSLQLVENVRFVSLMLDEATLFKTSVVILYLRGCLPGTRDFSHPCRGAENVYLGLAEANEGTNVDGIVAAVDSLLESYNIDVTWLKQSLIGICTDGASVMTGRENGVALRLSQKYGEQRIELFHCLAHRLELAVDDALKAVTATNHFQAFVQKLYSLYSQSPKNMRELKEAAALTETELLKITSIFTVRWVASSFRVVRAIWRDFQALHSHLQSASVDSSRSSSERGKFQSLARHLASVNFVQDVALLKDVLRELKSTSMVLQKRETSVCIAVGALNKTISVIKAIKDSGCGKSMRKVHLLNGHPTPAFKKVPLTLGKCRINPQQFMQAVIDCLQRRLPATNSRLLNELRVLEKTNWPVDDERILFGDATVLQLAKRLGLPGREVVENFRDFKDGKPPGHQLAHLLDAAETFPATSAECERGFSAMNNTATDNRNGLSPDTISDLLFLKLNGPPLDDFSPEPFVRKWLQEGHRRSSAWKPGPSSSKASENRRVYSLTMPKS